MPRRLLFSLSHEFVLWPHSPRPVPARCEVLFHDDEPAAARTIARIWLELDGCGRASEIEHRRTPTLFCGYTSVIERDHGDAITAAVAAAIRSGPMPIVGPEHRAGRAA